MRRDRGAPTGGKPGTPRPLAGSRTIRNRALLALVGVLFVSIAAAALQLWRDAPVGPLVVQLVPAHRDEKNAVLALPAPDLLRPLTPQDAIVENASRPTAVRPDQPAAPFRAKFADDESRARALECLTQAVYYEAASEIPDGRRAVAQVVLNRVRHPAYPSTICGVVYQGSERTTGCQFSFTCDGALRRPPAVWAWNEARQIAVKALAGTVFGAAGHATSYHADYVVPYWADSLDKKIQVGRHIFYRLRNGLGAARAFRQAYRGREPAPLSPSDVQLAATVIETASAPPDSGLVAPTVGESLTPKPSPILADLSRGQLLLDERNPSPALPAPAGESRGAPTASGAPDCQRPLRTAPLDNRIGRNASAECR